MIEIDRIILEDTEKNNELYNELMDNSNTELLYKVSPITKLYRIDDYGLLFCLNTEINQVTFMMQYGFGHHEVFSYYINEMDVWLMPDIEDIKNIDKQLFFNYIIKYFEMVFVESKGDWDGKRFWLDCIMQAYKNKLSVYHMDFETNLIKQINTLYDWGQFVGSNPKIWMKGVPSEVKRIIITSRYIHTE